MTTMKRVMLGKVMIENPLGGKTESSVAGIAYSWLKQITDEQRQGMDWGIVERRLDLMKQFRKIDELPKPPAYVDIPKSDWEVLKLATAQAAKNIGFIDEGLYEARTRIVDAEDAPEKPANTDKPGQSKGIRPRPPAPKL